MLPAPLLDSVHLAASSARLRQEMDQDRREGARGTTLAPRPPLPTPSAGQMQARTAAGTQGPVSFYFFCDFIFLIWRLKWAS